jgi:hypothetical protein
MGWWRRNRWGLVLVLPGLLVLLALSAQRLRHELHDSQLTEPAAALSDGSYELEGTRVRLIDIGPATGIKTYDGNAFTPPGNVVIWQVRLDLLIVVPKPAATGLPTPTPDPSEPPHPDVTLPPETQLGACTLTLEDGHGRRYDDEPDAFLEGADVNHNYGCLGPFDATDPMHYEITALFALPRDTRPVALLVSHSSLPHYIRIPVGRADHS